MSSPVTIIVDERDARINYSGTWAASGSSADYKRTSYTTNDTNAAMTFQFNGTSIALYGDLEPGGSCSGSFSVDDASTSYTSPAVTQSQRQTTLFTKSDLTNGMHTFVYKVGSCQKSNASASGPFVFVDHVIYTALDPVLDGLTYFIDDRDARLQYSGSWTQQSTNGSFQQTASGGASGSSVKYEFTGTSISVYGSLFAGTGPVKASVNLDGKPQQTFTSGSQNSSNVEFFTSDRLTPGQHTLELLPQGEALLWLDYLLVDPGSAASFPPPKASGKNIGAIVGGALGGALALIGAFAVFWMMLKRRGAAAAKHSNRYSGAGSSTKYFWRKNEGSGTGAELSYAASTGASSMWSKRVDSIRTATTGVTGATGITGITSRRLSSASRPVLPSTRPGLYSPLEDASPGLPPNSERTPRHDETTPLPPSDYQVAAVYPPTPPYNTTAFDPTQSRPHTPARSNTYSSQPSSPSYTVTTFDRSVAEHEYGVTQDLRRSPSYRTTAPELHSTVSSRATSPTRVPSVRATPRYSTVAGGSHNRRASLTPSYITTVPVNSTLEISDFLPPHVAAARQEALAQQTTPPPPSSFARIRNGPVHDRSPSYATTAPELQGQPSPVYAEFPPVPPLPSGSRVASPPPPPPRILEMPSTPTSSSKAPNVPATPPQPPPSSLPSTSSSSTTTSRATSRSTPSPGRPAGPRSGQPLPRPPSPSSRSQTSTIHGGGGGVAPSTMSVGTVGTIGTVMSTADMKRLEATGSAVEEGTSGGGEGSSPEAPPPQYAYRF